MSHPSGLAFSVVPAKVARATIGLEDVMTRNILILGASYGSLLGTKLLMAGHDVT